MPKSTTLLTLARLCLLVAICLTLRSAWNIWGHAGGEDRLMGMLLVATPPAIDNSWAVLHSRLHFGREAILLFATMIAAAMILFAPARLRTPHLWMLMLVLLVAATGGHWLSALTTGADPMPSPPAAQNHLGNTVFSLLALLLSAKEFFSPTRE